MREIYYCHKLDKNDSVRAVVFKKIVKDWDAHKEINGYCFSIDDQKDPSDSLLKELNRYRIPVKRISDCFYSPDNGTVLFGKGILFHVSKLDWKTEDEVKISAWGEIGNMGGSGCDYTLKKENEVWKIIATENCRVS